MNNSEILTKIDKIFRANTIEEINDNYPFSAPTTIKKIENIEELKNDIKELISEKFKKNKIDKSDVFVGNRKLGASYHISEAIQVAKIWGYKYVSFNGGEIYNINGEYTNLKLDEI